MADTPFDSLESAHEYVRLLASQVQEARTEIETDTAEAARDGAARRVDALHIVDYKLKQLGQHMAAARRILNDLRILRRLLVSDRDTFAEGSPDSEVRD
jgi:ribosomal protein S3AE